MAEAKKPRPSKQTDSKSTRPTIGFLVFDLYQFNDVWNGVIDAARANDVNLLCFDTGRIHTSDSLQENPRRILTDFITAQKLSGLITFQWWQTREWFEQVCGQRYHPLPIVNIMRLYDGYAGIVPDSYNGMHGLVQHLVEEHNYRQFVYLSGPGNPTNRERHKAYEDVLAKYEHIHIEKPVPWSDPDGVSEVAGANAIRTLLDERKLTLGEDIEAIVAFNDRMALGALEVLKDRGVRVPADVAVVGSDDFHAAKVSTPPLSTVALPWYELGVQAVELLLPSLEGERVVEHTRLPAKPVIRRSCGCIGRAVEQAEPNVGAGLRTAQTFELALANRQEELLTQLTETMTGTLTYSSDWAKQLLAGFVVDVTEENFKATSSREFLLVLEELLSSIAAVDGNLNLGHDLLSIMYRHLWSCLPLDSEQSLRAEVLWQQGRVVVSNTVERDQRRNQMEAEEKVQVLREFGQQLITTVDMSALMDFLAEGLPRLDIPSAYLVLYENPLSPLDGVRLAVAYNENGRVELVEGGQSFAPSQFIPAELWPQNRQYSMVVEALHFGEEQIGFVLLESGPRDGEVYHILRSEISSALQGAGLFERVEQANTEVQKLYEQVQQSYKLVEKQVEERTAELKKAMHERGQAQEENLLLQQEIIETQQRTLKELSIPIIPILKGVIVVPLIGSIDSLRAQDMMRRILAGIGEQGARVVILDVTGVPIVDSGVAGYLAKIVQAARLKGTRIIVTGITAEVAETIVDLGIDWSGIETLSDLQTGLRAVLAGR